MSGGLTKDLHIMVRSRKPVVDAIECPQPKTMAPTGPQTESCRTATEYRIHDIIFQYVNSIMLVSSCSVPPPAKIFAAGRILFSGLSIREWVCAFWKTLRTPYLKSQWRKFHPILVTDVFGFIDVLIRFGVKRSKVKVTADGGITVDDSLSSSI